MPQTNYVVLPEMDIAYELPEEVSYDSPSYSSYIINLKQMNRMPFSKGEILYQDDIWDFSPYSKLNIPKSQLRFNFSIVAEVFRDDVKNYVLAKILENKPKIQSIVKMAHEIMQYFNYISERHIYAVEDIPISIVKEYVEHIRADKSLLKLRFCKSCLKDFYLQYSVSFSNIATPGLIKLFEYDDHKAFKAYKRQHKTKDIPDTYFDKLMSALIRVANDINIDPDLRAIACVYIILSQTGLRIGEILGLRTNSLITVRLFNGEEANYLRYSTWKREHGNNTSTIEKTYINPLSRLAVDILMELHAKNRADLKLDYLYMGSSKETSAEDFPLSSTDARNNVFDLLIRMDELGYLSSVNLKDEEAEDLHCYKLRHKYILRADNKIPVNTIHFPDTQQFRFHCCTVLYRKGVPMKYIQKFMGHLTNAMVQYHIYPKETPQEDMEYAVNVLKELVTGEAKILGNDKGLMERIRNYIEKEHPIRIADDLDAVCRELALTIPIRQKSGGVCIKSSMLRDCSHDAPTNEFYCAYGVCPNIVHFYYMADISYERCKSLAVVIERNRERHAQLLAEQGNSLMKSERAVYPKQIQKNINMLYSITTNQLLPELEDLKRAIEEYGVEAVYIRHPEVQEIAENYESILEEALLWKSWKS